MRQPKAPGGGKWRVPTARGAAWNQNHRCHNCVIIKIIIIIRGAAWNRHQNYHCHHHHHHHAGICQMYIFGHYSHHCLLSSVIPEECRPTKAKVGMVIQEPDINIIDSYTFIFFSYCNIMHRSSFDLCGIWGQQPGSVGGYPLLWLIRPDLPSLSSQFQEPDINNLYQALSSPIQLWWIQAQQIKHTASLYGWS